MESWVNLLEVLQNARQPCPVRSARQRRARSLRLLASNGACHNEILASSSFLLYLPLTCCGSSSGHSYLSSLSPSSAFQLSQLLILLLVRPTSLTSLTLPHNFGSGSPHTSIRSSR